MGNLRLHRKTINIKKKCSVVSILVITYWVWKFDLNSGSSGPGSSLGRVIVFFLCKTLHSHIGSPCSGVLIVTGKFLSDKMQLWWDVGTTFPLREENRYWYRWKWNMTCPKDNRFRLKRRLCFRHFVTFYMGLLMTWTIVHVGSNKSSAVRSASFPGSLILPPLGAREEERCETLEMRFSGNTGLAAT